MSLTKYKIIIAISLLSMGFYCTTSPGDNPNNKQTLNTLETDTLFKYSFCTSFDVSIYGESDFIITLVGKDNEVLQNRKNQTTSSKGKIENELYAEHIFTIGNKILVGFGTEYQIERLMVYDTSLFLKDSINSVNIISIKKNKALCLGDYSKKEHLSLKEKIKTFHFIYDIKNKDTLFKFKDGFLVVQNNDNYFEFDYNKYVRTEKEMDVIRYSSDGEILQKFSVKLKKNRGTPVHFFDDKFYLTYTPKAYYLFNSEGEEINEYNVSSIFKEKFHISDSNTLYVFGWLDADKQIESYAFLEKRFRLDFP